MQGPCLPGQQLVLKNSDENESAEEGNINTPSEVVVFGNLPINAEDDSNGTASKNVTEENETNNEEEGEGSVQSTCKPTDCHTQGYVRLPSGECVNGTLCSS